MIERRVIVKAKAIALVSALAVTVGAKAFDSLSPTDCYPLHHVLQYRYTSTVPTPNLLESIVKGLDIENNVRYSQTGVIYRNGKAYEVPLHELEAFSLTPAHYNTYCNIFVLDVLNILANTTQDESYRLSPTPVTANGLRKRLEQSPYWLEVSKAEAVQGAKEGYVVIMSYTENPHGHIAFVRADSTPEQVWLWNVGAVNEEKHKWNKTHNVKYFRKEW